MIADDETQTQSYITTERTQEKAVGTLQRLVSCPRKLKLFGRPWKSSKYASSLNCDYLKLPRISPNWNSKPAYLVQHQFHLAENCYVVSEKHQKLETFEAKGFHEKPTSFKEIERGNVDGWTPLLNHIIRTSYLLVL